MNNSSCCSWCQYTSSRSTLADGSSNSEIAFDLSRSSITSTVALQDIPSNAFAVINVSNEHYFAYGDFSQLWQRQMKSTGRIVAIKAFRMTTTAGVGNINSKFEAALLRLVQEWSRLQHQNIMPCLGISNDFGDIASLVMPMCPDGNINDYVVDHPFVNRLALLSQVAEGVAYLHSQGVVHGKICGKNIVVAPNGRPLITDTGLARVIQAQEGIFPWALPSDSLRWRAPETFSSEDDANTASSDVWSLGMTILEVMSGRMPYYPRRQLPATIFAITDGVLPVRPDNDTVSDSLWSLLHTIWAQSPENRPCAIFVQGQLEILRSDNLHHLYKL
ncbi:hypothetical protein HWV62_15293 [Athelia sp. TMB]|nr:hypothetical protein HWV62_15293 [Athelia sp. TMB]